MEDTEIPRHIRRRPGVNPPAYFYLSDQSNPLTVMAENVRRQAFILLEHLMHTDERPTRDSISQARKVLGFPDYKARRIVIAGMKILFKLPKTLQLQRELALLGWDYIGILASVLDGADPKTFGDIDEMLAKVLTPTMPCQSFPDETSFRKRLKHILVLTNPELNPEPTKKELPPFELFNPGQEGGPAELRAEMTTTDALKLDEAIRHITREYTCNREEAFYKLLFDNITVNLTLNIYRAEDIPDAPAWMSGVGWISGELRDELLAEVTKTRNIAKYKDFTSDSYRPSPGLRAYLEGRDGTCAVPGCNVPGHRCQKDHRVEYAEGGETSAKNLVDVCSFDHNYKTNGGLHYILDPETGTTIWLHTDGTFEIGLASGPLSPQGKWEAQTIGQYMEKRRKRARKSRLRHRLRPNPVP
ncbi:HNH endonuclease signature motif containing protein [Corynebacterium renale]|nr:HNH endonuclease signature motif containing protein [Corynebacterium renale]